MGMITLSEYAERHGKNLANCRQKIARGSLNAVKSGGIWLIDENEPYEDHRATKHYRESDYYKRRLAEAEERKHNPDRPKRKYTKRKKDQQ